MRAETSGRSDIKSDMKSDWSSPHGLDTLIMGVYAREGSPDGTRQASIEEEAEEEFL